VTLGQARQKGLVRDAPITLPTGTASPCLLKIYAHRIDRQSDAAKQAHHRRPLGIQDTQSGSEPSDEGQDDSEQAS
jgi:hypothetical protein